MTEPKVTLNEITVSASLGAKIQIQKYTESQDFHYSMTQKFSIDGELTDKEAHEIREAKIKELRWQLEGLAQDELDELAKQKEEVNA